MNPTNVNKQHHKLIKNIHNFSSLFFNINFTLIIPGKVITNIVAKYDPNKENNFLE